MNTPNRPRKRRYPTKTRPFKSPTVPSARKLRRRRNYPRRCLLVSIQRLISILSKYWCCSFFPCSLTMISAGSNRFFVHVFDWVNRWVTSQRKRGGERDDRVDLRVQKIVNHWKDLRKDDTRLDEILVWRVANESGVKIIDTSGSNKRFIFFFKENDELTCVVCWVSGEICGVSERWSEKRIVLLLAAERVSRPIWWVFSEWPFRCRSIESVFACAGMERSDWSHDFSRRVNTPCWTSKSFEVVEWEIARQLSRERVKRTRVVRTTVDWFGWRKPRRDSLIAHRSLQFTGNTRHFTRYRKPRSDLGRNAMTRKSFRLLCLFAVTFELITSVENDVPWGVRVRMMRSFVGNRRSILGKIVRVWCRFVSTLVMMASSNHQRSFEFLWSENVRSFVELLESPLDRFEYLLLMYASILEQIEHVIQRVQILFSSN